MPHLSAVPCTALTLALTLVSIPLRAADAGDVILEIVGMGPGTAVAAETR